MKKKALLLILPILTICLTSCGEGKIVKNFLMENGSNTASGYVFSRTFYALDNSSIDCSLKYSPESNDYTATTHQKESDNKITISVTNTMTFKWNNFKHGKFSSEGYVTANSRRVNFTAKFSPPKTKQSPEAEYAAYELKMDDTGYSPLSVDPRGLKLALQQSMASSTIALQQLLSEYIDAGVTLW